MSGCATEAVHKNSQVQIFTDYINNHGHDRKSWWWLNHRLLYIKKSLYWSRFCDFLTEK